LPDLRGGPDGPGGAARKHGKEKEAAGNNEGEALPPQGGGELEA